MKTISSCKIHENFLIRGELDQIFFLINVDACIINTFVKKKNSKKKKCRVCSFEHHKLVNTNLWCSKLHTRHFFFEFFYKCVYNTRIYVYEKKIGSTHPVQCSSHTIYIIYKYTKKLPTTKIIDPSPDTTLDPTSIYLMNHHRELHQKWSHPMVNHTKNVNIISKKAKKMTCWVVLELVNKHICRL
ncbi:hypothetical protein HanIR_Chr08g0359301 [Helianthus annuus]|nr:hypothetical protein HanIR_Chr08g0359301 [Helianthus annuus]